jgi:hypothetical protein
MGSKDIFEKTGELPRVGLGELRPDELVLPAGGCSSSPENVKNGTKINSCRVIGNP